MRRIVITGAECTGKTTLVRALARHYGAPWVPEAARVFVERAQRPVVAADVPAIATLSGRLSDDALREGPDLVFYDTDLLSTVAYARHYFGSCPTEIVERARARRGHLYVLASDEIPWHAEQDQRGTVQDRSAVQARIRAMLRDAGWPWIEAGGTPEQRVAAVTAAVDLL